MIYLDYPARLAMAGMLRRRFQPTQDREDMPEGWRERVSWSLLWSVLRFRWSESPKVRRLLATLGPSHRVVTLRSREDAERFLSAMATLSES